jgi:hypothetical protein
MEFWMKTNISSAMVNSHLLSVCLSDARDAVVDCETFLRGSYAAETMKEVRNLRRRLYDVFVQADSAEVSAFVLAREVMQIVTRMRTIKASAPAVVH